jgi:hypothetical protein
VVIDSVNGKLLVAVTNYASVGRPGLFRCELDGTGCTYSDISAGQGLFSVSHPSAAIDSANGKILVATVNGDNGNRPGLFRCNLDGTRCTYSDISAGQPGNSGYDPSAVIDSANGKLLVVTTNGDYARRPALFRCNLDGTGCTYSDLSAGQGDNTGSYPSALVDSANGKLLVVTQKCNPCITALFRCNLDGSDCTYSDLSGGQGNGGVSPSAVIDAASGKLFVATPSYYSHGAAAMIRCNLDGSGCDYNDIPESQWDPSAVIDSQDARLLVATSNASNEFRPSLWSFCLR